jgi:hypothetical protein
MIGTSLLFSGSIGGLLTPFDSVAPTAGYSLRNLGLSYSGAVVRVRKDITGNPEQDFTAGQITNGTLSNFLETLGTDAHSQSVSTQFEDLSDVSLICDCNSGGTDELDAFDALYENGFVSKWYDQFGSNDAEQSTANNQPKIWDASTGLVTENGKPAIDFSITDNNTFLENSSFQALGSSSRSVFIASNVFQVQNRPCLMYLGDNSGNGKVYALTLEYGVRVLGGNIVYDISQEIDNDQLSTFILPEDNTNVEDVLAFKNSVNLSILSTTPLEIDTASGLIIGKYFTETVGEFASLRGSVKEIIIYNSDQSANREAIEDNINDYYDIY